MEEITVDRREDIVSENLKIAERREIQIDLKVSPGKMLGGLFFPSWVSSFTTHSAEQALRIVHH